MQVTERAERALTEYMGTIETSPTESGDLEARAASMARSVGALLALKVVKTRVLVLNEQVLIRVQMRTPSGTKRTITAGVNAFSQVVHEALDEMPRHQVRGAIDALRRALAPEAVTLEAALSEAAEKITSSPEEVQKWKRNLAAMREARIQKDREDLVSRMTSLLVSGWTRDMLAECAAEAVCRSVMHG